MAKKRILVIEDDMDVAELLLMYFNSQGYEVFHADMGQMGIGLARAKLPNLILLDIMLPDMDGFSVCKALRETNLTRYIPTIFLTQRNASADKVAGLQLGADDYLTKPFDVEELRLRVKGSIERATRDQLHEPVTGLPTGAMVTDMINQFQNSDKSDWRRLDIKVAGFDAFRDAYGFLTANDALNLAAKVLGNGVSTHGTHDDFLGTVSSGQFIVLTYSEQVKTLISAIEQEFSERARSLYRYEDADRGYVVLEEGTSNEQRVPLMYFEVNVQDPISA